MHTPEDAIARDTAVASIWVLEMNGLNKTYVINALLACVRQVNTGVLITNPKVHLAHILGGFGVAEMQNTRSLNEFYLLGE